jgi:glucose/arabinose dehydrogenase
MRSVSERAVGDIGAEYDIPHLLGRSDSYGFPYIQCGQRYDGRHQRL